MRFFLLHNPKAGGSSLRAFLARASPDARVAPVFGNAPHDYRALDGRFAAFAGFDSYAGHYGYEVYQALADGHALITNFRDPVGRIHSLYRYWRNSVEPAALTGLDARDAAIVRSASELSFADFIRQDCAEAAIYTSNFHTRQLYRDGWSLEGIDSLGLETVKRRISAMPWFYIAESPEVSLYLFGKVFGEPAGGMPRENVSAGPADALAAADVAYVIAHNRLDYAIYAHAWHEQVSRLRG